MSLDDGFKYEQINYALNKSDFTGFYEIQNNARLASKY